MQPRKEEKLSTKSFATSFSRVKKVGEKQERII